MLIALVILVFACVFGTVELLVTRTKLNDALHINSYQADVIARYHSDFTCLFRLDILDHGGERATLINMTLDHLALHARMRQGLPEWHTRPCYLITLGPNSTIVTEAE